MLIFPHFLTQFPRTYLYSAQVLEILAIKIRKNEKIKGTKINNNDFILTQYADDITVILDGLEESLNETLHELEQYAKISGLKVNFFKTHVV